VRGTGVGSLSRNIFPSLLTVIMSSSWFFSFAAEVEDLGSSILMEVPFQELR